MHKTLILLILIIFLAGKANSQTATIATQVAFPNAKETVDYIRFKINNQSFGARDTVIQIRINTKGFDSCEAIIANDTLRFLTKFKEGELYEITQGCCCAAFILKPKNNANRGTVTFNNKTKRDLALTVAEANIDTIQTRKTETIFASESAMCVFKPCSIVLSETAYWSDKYSDYDDKEYVKLKEEQASYILGKTWFHFLHGEKLKLEYKEKKKSIQLKLIGYLTDKEYKTIWLE